MRQQAVLSFAFFHPERGDPMSEAIIIVSIGSEALAFTPEQVAEARQRAKDAGFGGQLVPTPEPEGWLTIQQAADRLGCSKAFLYDRTRTGKVPCHKIGTLVRFKASELDAWAADHGPQDGPPKNRLSKRAK
jgi:excisionase family DNA binding protein